MLAGVHASDIADGSKHHGALSKYMSLRSGMIYSDKPTNPMAHSQDTMEFTPAQAGALRISKVLEPQKISDEDEDKDGQKLFSNASNMLIGLSAIGVALLSFAAMAGVRMR